jgi:hypothetical protein
MAETPLLMGEVHTQLLQNRTEVDPTTSASLLALRADERPRVWLRPMAYTLSPELLSGVDCGLRTGTGARTHGVGTARVRAAIRGGRVLQTSTYAEVPEGTGDHRRPWSYYLARPGVIETVGRRAAPAVLADGFLGGEGGDELDLGSVSGRLMDRVQVSRSLDRRAPFRGARTRLRWVAEPAGAGAEVHFTLVSDTVRTLRLRGPQETGPAMAAVCEDLAFHDWLLTSLLTLSARIGAASAAQLAERLTPPVEHLLHLWMPTAHVDRDLRWPWEALEDNPGFTRQWRSAVDRIRDRIAVNTLDLLSDLQGRKAE